MEVHHILSVVLLFIFCACLASIKELTVLLGGRNIRVAEGDIEFSTSNRVLLRSTLKALPGFSSFDFSDAAYIWLCFAIKIFPGRRHMPLGGFDAINITSYYFAGSSSCFLDASLQSRIVPTDIHQQTRYGICADKAGCFHYGDPGYL